MTKKELVKWVEHQRELKLQLVHSQKEKNLRALRSEWEASFDLTPFAQKICDLVKGINDTWEACKEHVKHQADFNPNVYGFSYYLRDFERSTAQEYADRMLCNFRRASPWHEKQEEVMFQFRTISDEVRKNYGNVLLAVQGCKTAALAMKYLEELGFDLSDLKKAEPCSTTAAISTKVDTKYLFLNNVQQEDKEEQK